VGAERSGTKRVVMIGPPNVGKSVIFNRLTRMNVGVANYPGSTVEFSEGALRVADTPVKLIDAPGIYTLQPASEAESVAVALLEDAPDLVLCVLDATNLESSLYLLLQLMGLGLPLIACINRTDLAEERGLAVDHEYLAQQLGVPTVATRAVTGQGLEELRSQLKGALSSGITSPPAGPTPTWAEAERLTQQARRSAGRSGDTLRDRLGDALVRPWPGLPAAALIVVLIFGFVIGVGMGLRRWVLLPFFGDLIIPQLENLVHALLEPGLGREVLVGEYGLLTKGIEWPFTLVLPYVLSFYAALGVLEDSGYMARLGALLDGLLKRMGLSGTAVMPIFLGYGCGIPALMATRALSSHKQRLTVCAMVCLSVPCISQTGAFVSLLAERSVGALAGVATVSILAMLTTGVLAGKLLPGSPSTTLMEIPELLLPRADVLGKKVWARARHYLADGVPAVMAGVAFAALLYETGAMQAVGRALSPVITRWLLLPEEAAVPLLLGVFRRELAVLPLMDMALSSSQLFTGAIVALFYVPCIAMVALVAREFHIRLAIVVLVFTTAFALFVGGLFARLAPLVL